MADSDNHAGAEAAWQTPEAPCVYCGQVIPRASDRCPHCRTSYSVAVRRASREVIGDWFYLDPRNPSGRGVTFETLVKMVEKGRIRPDSIVRGPPTHHDWMYAAETPRLAKYLGLCPHCFAETTPDQTFCGDCHRNMNERPGSPQPGVPIEDVKEPVHAEAHELEMTLAGREEPPAPQPPAADVGPPAPTPTPHSEPLAAVAAAGAADRPKARPAPAGGGKRPSIWVVLFLTWLTMVPLFLLGVFTSLPLLFLPSGCEPGVVEFQNSWKRMLGRGPADPVPPPPEEGLAEDTWLNEQLRLADRAESAGNLDEARAVFERIYAQRPDQQQRWLLRIRDIDRKIEARRKDHLDAIQAKVRVAQQMANDRKFDDALAVLRNIGADDRTLVASIGFSVGKMIRDLERDRQQYEQALANQRQQIEDALAAATRLRAEGKLQEALDAYRHIGERFPGEMIGARVNLDQLIRDVQDAIRAGAVTPPPPHEPILNEKEVIAKVADFLEAAKKLEQEEKFAEALQKLESIRKFDEKYWPEQLDKTYDEIKRKKEALEFFGMDG